MKEVVLRGTVITGEGNGKKYLSLPWVRQQIEEKLGYLPYLGTLNVRLTRKSVKNKRTLLKIRSIVICPADGFCMGTLFKAFVLGSECAVVLPEVEKYPENLLEIIAPVNLRERLLLEDGDTVEIAVQV